MTHSIFPLITSANSDGCYLTLRQVHHGSLWEATASRALPSDLSRFAFAIGFHCSPDLAEAITAAHLLCLTDYETQTLPEYLPAAETKLDLLTMLGVNTKPTYTGTVRRT